MQVDVIHSLYSLISIFSSICRCLVSEQQALCCTVWHHVAEDSQPSHRCSSCVLPIFTLHAHTGTQCSCGELAGIQDGPHCIDPHLSPPICHVAHTYDLVAAIYGYLYLQAAGRALPEG